MSSEIEELMPLVQGKGSTMRLFIDHSKPEDSPEHNWSELSYDGKEDSVLLSIPNHWHQYHDEIMEVLEGRMIFYLDGKEIVASAGDAPIHIPRGHVHGFTAIKGVPVRFTEHTQPSGTFKAHFFQDLLQLGRLPGFLLIMRVCYDGDTYFALPGGWRWLDYMYMTVFGFISKPFVPGKPIEVKKLV